MMTRVPVIYDLWADIRTWWTLMDAWDREDDYAEVIRDAMKRGSAYVKYWWETEVR